MTSEVLREPLRRSARYRFHSVLLRPSWKGRRVALRALARELEWDADPAPLVEPSDDDALDEGFRLLGQAGPVSLCASDYVEGGFADKGPILGDIAGFYEAFGFQPSLSEPPDNFANLLEFLSFLALKEAWALQEGEVEQAQIARDAEQKMLNEHVAPYLPRFARKLAEAAPSGGIYAAVADCVGRFAAA